MNTLTGDELKTEGMAVAAEANPDQLSQARGVARELAELYGVVDSDMVMTVMAERHAVYTLGPAAGSLFTVNDWRFTGDFVKSTRPKNHSRLLRRWSLATAV